MRVQSTRLPRDFSESFFSIFSIPNIIVPIKTFKKIPRDDSLRFFFIENLF